MQVADIKCFCKGTNSDSFLKEGDYSSALSSLDSLSTSLDSNKDTLKGEMSGGGLDASALNLGGFSPLFEMGYNASTNISNATNSVSEIREIIESDAKTHMTNEWGKFYQETYKCTQEKKKAMDSAYNSYTNASDENKSSAKDAYLSAKSAYEEHNEMLESIKGSYDGIAGSTSSADILELDFDSMASSTDSSAKTGGGYNSDGSTAQEVQASVYDELSALGYSRAGICAILANMQAESAFDLTAVGDGGTSFGLCQWHDGRWNNLNSFCEQNGLDPNSVKGQVAFLDHELKTGYPDLYNQLQNGDDTQENAQNLAKIWCTDFERPANASDRAVERAGYVGTYWDRSEGASTGASVISGYKALSTLNTTNNKKAQAVKVRDYDTKASSGQSSASTEVAAQIASYAANNCPGTTGWCAAAVETAVTAVTGIGTSGNAEDLLTNGSLESAGYVRQSIDPGSSDYQPLPGDIVVCNEGYASSGYYSEYGHAQIYTENGWYSDHKQDGIYLYSNENALYRYEGKN